MLAICAFNALPRAASLLIISFTQPAVSKFILLNIVKSAIAASLSILSIYCGSVTSTICALASTCLTLSTTVSISAPISCLTTSCCIALSFLVYLAFVSSYFLSVPGFFNKICNLFCSSYIFFNKEFNFLYLNTFS